MRLLLAEDDPMIGSAVEQGLRDAGFAIDWVRDGDAAELALRSDAYALLVLDLGLTRQDRASRRCARCALPGNDLPVLIVTARGAVSDRVTGLNLGADDYLAKPFDLDELVARIRAPAAPPRRTRPARAASGRAGARSAGARSALDGATVALANREFALLEALFENPGAVLTCEQLEDRLYGWGEGDRQQRHRGGAPQEAGHGVDPQRARCRLPPGRRRMKTGSIRRNLLVWQIGALLASGLLASVITFVLTWNALNQLRDDGLAQIAYSIVRHGLVSSDGDGGDDEHDAADKGQFVSQIWNSDGELEHVGRRQRTAATTAGPPRRRLAWRQVAYLHARGRRTGRSRSVIRRVTTTRTSGASPPGCWHRSR